MITITIIILTVLLSMRAFKDHNLMDKLMFDPQKVKAGEWHRLFTYGGIHADYPHLIFNMFTLYFFGMEVERICKLALGSNTGSICFIVLYISSLAISILPTYFKQKNNHAYRGLGASGAVSAIVFAYVLVNPMNFMGIMFIPVMLPAFLFGIIFLLVSFYLDRKQTGRINHSAHISGGIYGLLYMTVVFFTLENINLPTLFLEHIKIDSISDLFYFGM
ncbi:rhomboid family intramembrane serine protease [Proteiniphilum sp.]|uniref:rhomboid family intramembrane serine protease n=1 Tax=Proteiniphilum sp. TaxID=1926877 RepID=UPI003329514F